jgi:exosortase A
MKLSAELFADANGVRPASRSLRSLFAVCLAVGAILAVHWRTVESIVAIWWRSPTFTHGFVVIPICLWLAWRRRDALARVEVRPWWPGLIGVFGAGLLWLVSSAADVLVAKQFALVFMLQAAIVTVIGTSAARVLAFPLAFLLFAVPAGEALVPTLIDWTADFAVGALRASGIPVYREANHFIIPSGAWSVVEECAGLRYLIASLMVGTLYAALAYRSALRRAAFIAASILVPIVANWFRAYLIIMLAHLTNNTLAVGVDHLIYGWLFFGVVMLLLFWIGSFWREAEVPSAERARPGRIVAGAHDAPPPLFRSLPAAIAAIAAASVWLPTDAAIRAPIRVEAPVLPIVAGGEGWSASQASLSTWKPHYLGFASERAQTFRKDGRDVGLYLAFYRQQEKGRELVTSGNNLVGASDWNWRLLTKGADSVDWLGARQSVDASEIAGAAIRLQVFRLYWVSGRVTASQAMAKLLTAWSMLMGHGDDSALIIIYAPQKDSGEEARAVLRGFVSTMSPAIERALAATREGSR